jgi:rare lipoprotein A
MCVDATTAEPGAGRRRAPRPVRIVAVAALAAVVAGAAGSEAAAQPVPAAGATSVSRARLATLAAEVDAATHQAAQAAQRLLAQQASDVYLRVALERIADQRRAAQLVLDRRAHDLYEATTDDPVGAFLAEVRTPDQQLLDNAAGSSGRSAARLFDQAARQAGTLSGLQRQADRLRASLQRAAAGAYAAQDRARQLLAQAQGAYAAARLRAGQAAAEQAALAARAAQLDALSSQVTLAVAVDGGDRGRAALGAQQPLLARLRAAGAGYPAGYAATGQVITGESSWYGPGFAGNPTASGAPYDPEQLTCAMLAVPLGTVVRVTAPATGRSVDLLVNDRGPYADGRVVDVSHAGADALGFSGVAQVRIEVLAPTSG